MFARVLLLLVPIASLGCGINNNCGPLNPFGCAKDDGADGFGTTAAEQTTNAPTTSTSTSTSTTDATTTPNSSGTTIPVDPTTAAETTTVNTTTTSTDSSTTAESTETTNSTGDTTTSSESTMPPVCGDGIVNGTDECDEMAEDTQTCDDDCTLAVCNDGHLNMAAGEECEDGNLNPKDSCDNKCHIVERRVFVTSTDYSSNLKGLSGADAVCQGLANGKGFGGNYKAWLSTGSPNKSSPSTRFGDAGFTGRYMLVDGKTKVADGWADLTDGLLDSKINLDENSASAEAVSTWTNTAANGVELSNSDCAAWSGGGIGTTTGSTAALDGKWTNSTTQLCSGVRRLYCFEVP